jgi:urease accessory protein
MFMTTDNASLLLLLNWMSPTFPIGSFAYSHGLEQAIANGQLKTAGDIEDWISSLVQHGSGWSDAVFFAQVWSSPVEELNELALALAGSSQRFSETTQLGYNFNIAVSVWTDEAMPANKMAYPVAAGRACKVMGISRPQALLAFLQGFCAAQVSVAVRLVPLGQTAGLRILRNLSSLISATAERAAASTLDDIGSACFAADIAAMQHETLEPRIFRT